LLPSREIDLQVGQYTGDHAINVRHELDVVS